MHIKIVICTGIFLYSRALCGVFGFYEDVIVMGVSIN